jgi:hypothetical protein
VKGRAAAAVLAVLVGALVVYLIVYAGGTDTYYSEGDVSRWDHSRRGNAWVLFAVSIGLGVAAVVGLMARAAGKATNLGIAIVGLTVLALLSFPFALVGVTTGH